MPRFVLENFPSAVRKKRSLPKNQQNRKNQRITDKEFKSFLKDKSPLADYYKESDYLEPQLANFENLMNHQPLIQTPFLSTPSSSAISLSSDISSLKDFTSCDQDLTNFLVELNQEDDAKTQRQNKTHPILGEVINLEAQSNIEVQITANHRIYCPVVN